MPGQLHQHSTSCGFMIQGKTGRLQDAGRPGNGEEIFEDPCRRYPASQVGRMQRNGQCCRRSSNYTARAIRLVIPQVRKQM
ncbi:hypothetical protein Droror1_Dr00020365, partial [Drosera rotundifolia]